jgi:hypothetical protein
MGYTGKQHSAKALWGRMRKSAACDWLTAVLKQVRLGRNIGALIRKATFFSFLNRPYGR